MNENRNEECPRLLRDAAAEPLYAETNDDYYLPDYLPEIRKILRLDAHAVGTGIFAGSERTEFGGTVFYTLYYTGPEGKITAVPLSGEYEYSLPVRGEMPGVIYTRETVETAVCRPSGPRKVNLRARVCAHPHALAEENAQPPLSAVLPEGEEAEKLLRTREQMHSEAYVSGELSAEAAVPLDGLTEENLRILSAAGEIYVESAKAEDGRIRCRGALYTEVLAEAEGVPFAKQKKIPFEAELEAQGARTGDAVSAWGVCESVTTEVRPADGGVEILLDLRYVLHAVCYRNVPLTLTGDLYSCGHLLDVRKTPCVTTRFAGQVSGNYTVSATADAEEEWASAELISLSVTPGTTEATVLPRRVILSGQMRAAATYLSSGEEGEQKIGASSYPFPFRIEAELPEEIAPTDRVEYFLTPFTCAGKCEQGKLSMQAEVALSLCVFHDRTDEVPEAVTVADRQPEERTADLLITYPSPEESLWSIGKKYGVPLAKLQKENGLPDTEADADDPACLDGVMWLSVSLR